MPIDRSNEFSSPPIPALLTDKLTPRPPAERRPTLPIHQRLFSALDSVHPDNFPRDLREKQIALLKKLHPNIVEELHAHVMATQKEQDRYNEQRGLPKEIIKGIPTIQGRLFEMLVQIEEDAPQSEAADELLVLLQNADRFDMESELGSGRNPDIALVDYQEEAITIRAVVEAKSGPSLDYRCYRQLLYSGVRQHLGRIVDNINAQDNLSEKGLNALAKKAGKIEISPNFRNILYLTGDKEGIRAKDLVDDRSFINTATGEFNRANYGQFISILDRGMMRPENPDNPVGVTVKYSSFSHTDVVALTKMLHALIVKRLPPSR